MSPGVDVLRPSELSASDRTLWAAMRAARPELASPYFDFRYTLAAAEVVPGAALAVIHRAGCIEAFLPFQRRGRLIQPLGAPLTDYHGLIARPDARIDLARMVRALGAERYRFCGLIGAPPPRVAGRGIIARPAMIADVSAGYDAWLQTRRAAGQGGFLKDKRRRLAALVRDHGEPAFEFGPGPRETVDEILAGKRRQLAGSGQHDIFDCGWTRDLIHRLAEPGAPDFGVRVATLKVQGRTIAAEIGLRSGRAHHLWFPIYDPAFARYSPGALMTLETLRAAAGQGCKTVDFGPGAEAYKRAFAEPGALAYEGALIAAEGPAAILHHLDPTAASRRLGRRWDRIAACEPHFGGQARATTTYLDVLRRRHPRIAAVGAGLGLGVTLGLLAE